jgi:hypothetical protein
MSEDTKRICWYGGYFTMVMLVGLFVWWADEQKSKLRYSVTCYTTSETPIYEGVAVGRIRGDAKRGFHFTDTNGAQQRIAANCLITSLPSID